MIRHFTFCQRGATAIEYGLIAALIVLVIIGSIAALGGESTGLFNDTSTKVEGAISGN